MIKTPDFLTFQPIFKERLWGGRELEKLGFIIPDGNIGECWGISAHPHGMSIIDQGPHKGLTLEDIYKQYPQWFNDEKKNRFPLLFKILDAREDLSVQVHPNDEFALKYENDFGKHEAWYVLHAKPNTRIQIGHHESKISSLRKSIESNQWYSLLHYFPSIKKGDFIDIPSGTLHALCSGSLIFEVQQSSDVTYRVFDYNRSNNDGKKRELHLDKALQVINIPDNNHKIINEFDKSNKSFSNKYFKIQHISNSSNKNLYFYLNKYICGYVIKGRIKIYNKYLEKNDFFIFPSSGKKITLSGNFSALFITSNF